MTTEIEIKIIPPVTDLLSVCNQTNDLQIGDSARAELINTLSPIAQRIDQARQWADTLSVGTAQQADQAAATLALIRKDAETAETALRDFDEGLIARLHKLHRTWTALVGAFTDPLNAAIKKGKGVIIAWQAEEARKAEAERARLQREADERARKEREKQEALARAQREKEEAARRAEEEARRKAAAEADEAKRKILLAEADRKRKEADAAALKVEWRTEQAAAVVAPVVRVCAPTAAVKSQKVWKVKDFDMSKMGIPVEVQGYITVETTRLERAKAANSMLSVSGVEFHQIMR